MLPDRGDGSIFEKGDRLEMNVLFLRGKNRAVHKNKKLERENRTVFKKEKRIFLCYNEQPKTSWL
jgi:hypothetical protein